MKFQVRVADETGMENNPLIVIDLDDVETIADLLPDAAAQDRLVADLNDEEDPERFDGQS